MAPAIERAGYGGRYANVDRPRSPGGPARAVPVRYTTAREVLAVAITREQLHRALDSLPEASLPDLAEYIDWLRQREEPLSPDELAEVQAADERVRRGEFVLFDTLRAHGRGHGS